MVARANDRIRSSNVGWGGEHYNHNLLYSKTCIIRIAVIKVTVQHTLNTMPARGSDGLAKTRLDALSGCRSVWRSDRRDVSRMRDGFPSRASMKRPATPVPILAE